MTLADRYRYTVVWSDEDKEYVASVAEFPSMSWVTDDMIEALVRLRKAIEEIVADMLASGESPPSPYREIDQAMAEVKATYGDALHRLGGNGEARG